MKVRIAIEDAQNGLVRAGQLVKDCIVSCGREGAAKMEAYAKQNRPWTDRTGNARNTLEGVLIQGNPDADGGVSLLPRRVPGGDGVYTLGIVGHMPYSVFLELAYGERYAILRPTVNVLAPDILRSLAAEMERLK